MRTRAKELNSYYLMRAQLNLFGLFLNTKNKFILCQHLCVRVAFVMYKTVKKMICEDEYE